MSIAETSANGDHLHEVEYQEQLDGMEDLGMTKGKIEWEEISHFDGDEDSDHGLKIYDV